MTNEQTNIVIAKACPSIAYYDPMTGPCWRGDTVRFDPVHDQNAMHAVEETMTADEAREYHNLLGRTGCQWLWHIECEDKAKAFLSVLLLRK